MRKAVGDLVTTINDRTKIGLFVVLGAIPTFAGFVFWLTMIYSEARAATITNEKQDQKMDAQTIILLDIRDKVTRLEAEKDRKNGR